MQLKNTEFVSDTKAHQTAAVGDRLYECVGSYSGTSKSPYDYYNMHTKVHNML